MLKRLNLKIVNSVLAIGKELVDRAEDSIDERISKLLDGGAGSGSGVAAVSE
jgi:hypothetical protein